MLIEYPNNTIPEHATNDSKVYCLSIGYLGVNRSIESSINGMVLKSYILRTIDFTILGPKLRTYRIDILKYTYNHNPLTLTPCYIPIVQ